MSFKTFWLSMAIPERQAFAQRCGASYNYLNHYAFGAKKRIGESVAIAIDRESGRAVSMDELRTDVDWDYVRSTRRGRKAAARKAAQ